MRSLFLMFGSVAVGLCLGFSIENPDYIVKDSHGQILGCQLGIKLVDTFNGECKKLIREKGPSVISPW